MFQYSEISFSEKKIVPLLSALSRVPVGIAMRSQRQKLPFACNQRKETLPVRIAWQGAGGWVSHCDTRVLIEAKNVNNFWKN